MRPLESPVSTRARSSLAPSPEIYSWSGVMPNDFSVWTLVLDASPIVQVVVALLVLASVVSWAIIFRKTQVISGSRRQAEKFETAFWSAGDLTQLYRSVETKG